MKLSRKQGKERAHHWESYRERYMRTNLPLFKGLTEHSFTPVIGWDRHDILFINKGEDHVGEIKVGDTNYTSLLAGKGDWSGAIIEEEKFHYLMSQYYAHGWVPVYINFFMDGW